MARRLRAEAEPPARTMTAEGGKPLLENRDELEWTAAAFDYYAEIGRDHAGRVIPPIESSQLAMVVKDPLGVESAIRCMRELRAGTVWINDPLTDNDAGPFGGFKQSDGSSGREGLEAFQETKHVHMESKIERKEWWYPYREYGAGSG